MGLGLMMVLAGAAAAGYLGVKKLKEIEKEIRQGAPPAAEPVRREPLREEPSAPVPESPSAKAEKELSLEARIIDCLTGHAGMLQTELYGYFPEQDRKTMQGILLEMARSGQVRREKEGSTYRLFVP